MHSHRSHQPPYFLDSNSACNKVPGYCLPADWPPGLLMEIETPFPCSIFHSSLVTLYCALQHRLLAQTTLLIFAAISFWFHALSSRKNFDTAPRTELPPQVCFNSGNIYGSKTQPIFRHLIHLQLTRVLPNPILIYDPWDSQKSVFRVTGFLVNVNMCCVCLCLVIQLCLTLWPHGL